MIVNWKAFGRSSHGLFPDATQNFTWKVWGKHRKPRDRVPVPWPRYDQMLSVLQP